MLKVHGFTYWGSVTFAATWGVHLSEFHQYLTFMNLHHVLAEDAAFSYKVND
jgi:hypothetical protein